MDLSLLTAFVAGIASFFAPCTIPVLPGFFAFLGGKNTASRWHMFGEMLLFVAGFMVIFIALGVGVNFLGQPLTANKVWFERIGGLLLVFFGIVMTGLLPFPWLTAQKRLRPLHVSSKILENFLFGATFGFAWTPCIGPVLGTILYFATGEETAIKGGVLLFLFSLGLALPFLIAALFVPELSKVLRKISWLARYSQRIFGALIIAIGVLLFFGQLGPLSGLLIQKLGTGLTF